MEFEPEVITALITAAVTLTGAWLVWRKDSRGQALSKAESDRDDDRESFKVVTDSQQNQITQLQRTVEYLRGMADSNGKRIAELTLENGGLREKLVDLEARLTRRELCPYAREGKCPLGLIAVAVAAGE